jgi:hypothetical protein
LAGEVKTFSIVVDRPDAEYTIEVGGTRPPVNVEITIENLGATAVENPRMTVNGLYDWFDTTSIVAEVTRGCRTDEEKAMALFNWILMKRFQRSPRDESATHPVRAMNGYGYGICGHNSYWLKCLCQAAGIRARVQELWGHTVNEVWFNGAWHLLDANTQAYYLDTDNRTLASLATLERNRELFRRTIHSHDLWIRQPDPAELNDEMAAYITTYKDNYVDDSSDARINRPYSMAMTLKPGERLTRWWTPELHKYEGRAQRAEAPERYANGQLVWEPDLKTVNLRPYVSLGPNQSNIAFAPEDHQQPALHVADLQDSRYTRPSVVTLPIASAYPIVGGRFSCTLVKNGQPGLASVSFGRPSWGPADLYTYEWGTGAKTVSLDLDSRLTRGEATYAYSLGFSFKGNAEAKPPAQAGLAWFRSETDLQVSPHSLPALERGHNRVRFRNQSVGPVKVRITHRWREQDGPAPIAVRAALPSADPALLRWEAVPDPAGDDRIADYQVLVSLRPDCRWALSPGLYRNLGSAKPEWQIPPGYLNPATTYYWRVRARDSEGNIGPWSPVSQFTTAAR